MKKISFFIACLIASQLTSMAQDKTRGVEFDGDDDYILVPNDANLDLGRSEFTIEAWIRADTANKNNLAPIVLSKKGNGSNSNGYLFGLDDKGKISLQLKGVNFGVGFGAKDLRDGQCHHIAWTREVGGTEDTVNGYVDAAYAIKSRQAAQLLDASSSDDLWIGWSEFNAGANIYQYKGFIKEIRIWNFAKTETQIFNDRNKHVTGSETGLVAYWRMNENFADTVYDCTEFENHGTFKNGATWGPFCDNLDAIPSSCVPDTGTGPIDTTGSSIAEYTNEYEVNMYPNPASKTLHWKSNRLQQANITIYSLTQQKMMEIPAVDINSSIDISSLKEGIYFVEFEWNLRKTVQRLVVH